MYRRYGFEPPRGGLAREAGEAARLAAVIGFPVALKVESPDILHKTDVGGVVLNLTSEGEVKKAFSRIMRSVREKAPGAQVRGISVQEMVRQGIELIIGLNYDPQFGPTIMLGLGGIFTEVLHDVSFRVLPITRGDAVDMLRDLRGRKILQGYRGQPPVSEEMVVDLLLKANHMGLDLADRLESVDLNPVMVWEDQHRVVDAKILLRDEARPSLSVEPNVNHLEKFFKATSVALVGASSTPGKIGHSVLDSLAKHQYRGKVYPVNPTHKELMGLKAYPALKDLPEPVDLVVVTIPLAQVPEVIRESAAQGIHNMVIISGGGKEIGEENRKLEERIKHLGAENGVRIVGCNCIGVFDGETRLDTFFQVHERMMRPPAGRVAMLTQSGTVGCAFLEAASPPGVSKFVSYGNRIDVDEADLLAYLAEDPQTDVIAMYVEGLQNGRKFLMVAREVARHKPIVIYKSGRTPQAAAASVSHTGFFGGTYGVAAGAFKQAGLIAVDSIEELIASSKALAMQPRARGNRIAMISNGAGTTVQAIDLLETYGLAMASLSPASLERLRAVYPPYFQIRNPIDVTGSGTAGDYETGIRALLEDPNVDIVMPWFVFQDTPLEESIVEVLARLSQGSGKPILCGAIGGPYTERMAGAMEAQGVPVFSSVRDWVAAARAVLPPV